MPVVVQRLTVLPSAVLAMKFWSRSAFSSFAIRCSASSQLMRVHSFEYRCPVLREEQTAFTVDEIQQSRALRAERAAVDGMIGIALDVIDRRLGVLRTVAQAVHEYAAGHRAVGAGIAGLGGPRQLELTHLRERNLGSKAECHEARTGNGHAGELHELAPCNLRHRSSTRQRWPDCRSVVVAVQAPTCRRAWRRRCAPMPEGPMAKGDKSCRLARPPQFHSNLYSVFGSHSSGLLRVR